MSNLVDQAIAKAQAGYHQTARELLQQAVKENPNDARAWYLLSQVIGDNAKAIDCLEAAHNLKPNSEQIKNSLARLRGESQIFEVLHTTSAQNDSPPELTSAISPTVKAYNWTPAFIVLLLALVAIVLFVIYTYSRDRQQSVSGPHTITVRLDTNGSRPSAEILFIVGNEQTSKVFDFRPPFEKDFQMYRGEFVSVIGYGGAATWISCELLMDGKPWVEYRASSGYAPVTSCSGMVGER